MRKFDDIDMRIANILGHDGRASNRDIARRLGISEGSVRQRLNRLIQNGTLRVTANLNVEELEDRYLAVVAIKLEGRRLTECAMEIDRLPGVQSTMIVTGQYDLILTVLLDSRQGLVDFVTQQLSHVQGVRDSETFVVLKNYSQWVPAAIVAAQTMGSEEKVG